jgi:acetyl-CoA acetyltransferase
LQIPVESSGNNDQQIYLPDLSLTALRKEKESYMPEAVLIDAVRTPIGALGGVLSPVRPDDLAAHVLKALVERTGIDPGIVEDVILGCANQAGEDNRNVARMALLLAVFHPTCRA